MLFNVLLVILSKTQKDLSWVRRNLLPNEASIFWRIKTRHSASLQYRTHRRHCWTIHPESNVISLRLLIEPWSKQTLHARPRIEKHYLPIKGSKFWIRIFVKPFSASDYHSALRFRTVPNQDAWRKAARPLWSCIRDSFMRSKLDSGWTQLVIWSMPPHLPIIFLPFDPWIFFLERDMQFVDAPWRVTFISTFHEQFIGK